MLTQCDKIAMLKVFLDITDNTQDNVLSVYLTAAKKEIIGWHLSPNSTATEVPEYLEMEQIHAVLAGYNLRGAENQKSHNENGINRTFHYTDMVQYIHDNISGYVKIL